MVNEHVFINLVSRSQPSLIFRLDKIVRVWELVPHALIGIINVALNVPGEAKLGSCLPDM